MRASKPRRISGQLLPLPAAMLHLLLILQEGERHAYFLKREVGRRSNGAVALSNGSIYSALRRMLTSGLIEESARRPEAHVDNPQRRYYRITQKGNTILQADLKRIRFILGSVSDQRHCDETVSLVSPERPEQAKGDRG